MPFAITPQGQCRIADRDYPAIGFGTYPLRGEVCANALFKAFEIGYRLFDTATFYRNFEPIGNVLKTQRRDSFYLISKVWMDSHTAEGISKDLQTTLKALNTPYLDAYLLHWPNSKVPIEETLTAMQRAQTEGLIRHIGLSNVTIYHLKRALEVQIPLSWVQNEMNPHFYEPSLLAFCQENAIAFQAWAPLGRGPITRDSLLSEIGKKHHKTASQIALRWILQHQSIPLPGSQNPEHMRENFAVMDFALSPEEMRQIDVRAQSGKRERPLNQEIGVGFTDEFDFSYAQCWPKF